MDKKLQLKRKLFQLSLETQALLKGFHNRCFGMYDIDTKIEQLQQRIEIIKEIKQKTEQALEKVLSE
jgi:hypothetical protein